MINRLKHRMKQDEGFTLIELLIVIVVLGILAAIVVFALSNQTGNSVVAACKSDAKAVEIAQEAYRADKGAPGPNNFAPDIATLVGGSRLVGAGPATTILPSYLRTAPSESHYRIYTNDTGQVFVYPTSGSLPPTNDPGDATLNFDLVADVCSTVPT